MALSINCIVISGRVTQQPDIHEVGSANRLLAKFGIAYNKEYATKSGKKKETVFLDVQAWERQADFVKKHIDKGDLLIIEGEMVMEQWKSKIGELRTRLVVRARNIQKDWNSKRDDADTQSDGGDTQDNMYSEPPPPVDPDFVPF